MDNEYHIEEPIRGAKKITFLASILIGVAILVTVVYYFTKVNQAASSEGREVFFTVEKGETSKQIGQKLNQEKIISSAWVFIVYTTIHNAGQKIQAGEYLLNANMPITSVVDILIHGRVVSSSRHITIIEGWTNKQISDKLGDPSFENFLETGNFQFKFNDIAKPLNYQGFLFPDTYTIDKDSNTEDLVNKMLKNFESKITNQMLSDIQSQHRNLTQIVILASIIEKEVGRNKNILTADDLTAMQQERTLVASVFYNRLSIGMALESDATINYITGKKDRQPLLADTKIKSPYNTYQVKGLPPVSIGNPGLGSIIAAIYPAKSDYLYFINKPDGEAVFAKTLAQHNANKAEFLK